MPSHNHRGSRDRHGGAKNTNARTTHGGTIDPTGGGLPLYGSQMDIDPVTSPDYQGQWHENDISDDAIGSRHLQELAVLSEALADNVIAQRHLQDQAVGTEELVVGSVTTDILAAFAVTAAKILAGSITADKINAAGLSALQITSGTLNVGGLLNTPDIINIFNDLGELIGVFDEEGVLLIDPDDQDKRMRFRDGVLEFTENGSLGVLADWGTAISATGIRADSIKVGIAPGGHNLVPNSSFENSPFTTGLAKEWTLDADFNAGVVDSNVNITVTGDALTLTTATY